jgi:hypothetical protein
LTWCRYLAIAVGLLLLDLVWVCFKLGDVRRLSVASAKLSRARTLLERAHGPGLERLRALQGGVVRPELALCECWSIALNSSSGSGRLCCPCELLALLALFCTMVSTGQTHHIQVADLC